MDDNLLPRELAAVLKTDSTYAALFALIPTIEPAQAAAITARPDWWFEESSARSAVDRAVGGARLEGLGFDLPGDLPGIGAAGGIVHYLDENEPTAISRIETLAAWRRGARMEIDEASRRSLELVRTTGIGGSRRSGSLAGVLDRTRSPMGARLLTDWLSAPLVEKRAIDERLDAPWLRHPRRPVHRLFGRRRQADDREEEPSHERPGRGVGGRREPLFLQSGQDVQVDRMLRPVVVGDGGGRAVGERLKRPPLAAAVHDGSPRGGRREFLSRWRRVAGIGGAGCDPGREVGERGIVGAALEGSEVGDEHGVARERLGVIDELRGDR
jgi:hypothetical protein